MSVAIFGATSRIAQELAREWAQRGEAVCVLARDAGEAARIAGDLAVRSGVAARAEVFDALSEEDPRALVARIEGALGPLTAAVVAFGEMGEQERAQEDPGALRRVLTTNFVGAAVLLEALAEPMAARGAGSLVVIGSVAGDRGRQSNYAYGSAKGGLQLFADGLRNRLFARGVHVLVVKPGFIDTRMTWGLETKIPIASPDGAARAILAALARKVDTLYYPAFWRGVMGVIKALPEAAFKRLKL